MSKLRELKIAGQDFEWYPTTNEILEKIQDDLHKLLETDTLRRYDIEKEDTYPRHIKNYFNINSKIKIDTTWENRDLKFVSLNSFLDIGAGDGRVFNFFDKDKIRIEKSFAVEKAGLQADDLIRKNIVLLGRDYFQTALYDKHFDVVFCNPPYSVFKEFVYKICNEINSGYIFLVIPERWKNDIALKEALNKKGDVEILGSYDFKEAEREARAKVDLIKISCIKNENTFETWVKENIGEFKADPEINLENFNDNEEIKNALEIRQKNIIEVLVENYTKEMNKLCDMYQQIGQMPFNILQQLDINKRDVLDKLKSDIQSLKNKYWRESFNLLDEITSRLTSKKRQDILSNIQWLRELDFNQYNIRTLIVWVIENYNKFTEEELNKLYDDLTDFENVRLYKSNDKWLNDGWRYKSYNNGKGVPEKYSLDYRIVVAKGSQFSNEYSYNRNNPDNVLSDLSIIAEKLGFKNDFRNFIPKSEWSNKEYNYYYSADRQSKEVHIKDSDEVLFEYRIYKNGNIHFKLNKELLKKINIEVGKIRGWLKKPSDVVDEFDLDIEEAEKLFYNKTLKIEFNENIKLLENVK